jgi:hypothetical protein
MQCRHTVADWHRYVDPNGASPPIMAACGLLIQDGLRARDAQGIVCAYWGRQRACPLYEGPGGRADLPAAPPAESAPRDSLVALDTVWPVRQPGSVDGLRRLLGGLTVLSLGLLGWSLALGVAVLGGHADAGRLAPVAVAAASFSMVTHLLAALKSWAGR